MRQGLFKGASSELQAVIGDALKHATSKELAQRVDRLRGGVGAAPSRGRAFADEYGDPRIEFWAVQAT